MPPLPDISYDLQKWSLYAPFYRVAYLSGSWVHRMCGSDKVTLTVDRIKMKRPDSVDVYYEFLDALLFELCS